MITAISPPNTIPHIETIWAVVSIDENGEGLCGAMIAPGMWTSLTTCEERLLPALLNAARVVAKSTGKKMKLVKFTTREEIRDIVPEGAGHG